MAAQQRDRNGSGAGENNDRRERRSGRGNDRDNRRNNENKNEYIERVVTINRVSKVVKGGRRFSFTALVVVGDGEGTVGVGYGKAKEVPQAISKGVEEAKKNFFRVPMIRRTITHVVQGRATAGVVLLRPAAPGTGVIAGGPVRAVLDCAGVHDVLTKSLGSSNAINIVHATVDALKQLEQPEAVAAWGRGHWGIENRLHWIRDVVFDEDRHQLSTCNGPETMAALRNLAISLIRLFRGPRSVHRRRHQIPGKTLKTIHQANKPTNHLNRLRRPPANVSRGLKSACDFWLTWRMR